MQLSPFEQIDAALSALDSSLLTRSGGVFYSGRSAFSNPCPLYILGLNPGGNPIEQSDNTIEKHIRAFRNRDVPWSEYMDEVWREGSEAGKSGMQPRVRHLIEGLGYDLRDVPASNTIFVRTKGAADLASEHQILLKLCMPVHEAVMKALGVRVILCFGKDAGYSMRQVLGANKRIDSYTEQNHRRWTSESHQAEDGKIIVTATHPSWANWCNPNSDPTVLVRKALGLY